MLRRLLLAPLDAERETHAHYVLLRFSRRAMATHFEIDIPQGTPNAADAAEAALDLIDELEQQLSIYRTDSEVSVINVTAFEVPVIVEESLFRLLQQSAHYTIATQGAFDIASGALIKAWGFHRREGRIPSPGEHAAAMQASGMKHVILGDLNRTVRFRRAGLELNLGSIGKGYALDRAGELLRLRFNIRSGLLHAGGSSVLALGSPPNDTQGWPVSITHPTQDHSLGTVRLKDRALATSAATYQHFEYNGRKYGHVLDPRTGWPAATVASASVVAKTAAEADALATAAFVTGDAEAFADAAVILADAADVTPDVFGFGPGEYE